MPMMLFQAHICRIHILHSARYMYIDMDHMIVYIYSTCILNSNTKKPASCKPAEFQSLC